MRAAHAEMFLAGKIRISSLTYFHRIEGAPAGVADQMEGRTFADLSGHYPGDGPLVFFDGETENDGWELHGDARRYPATGDGSNVRSMINEIVGPGLSKSNLVIRRTQFVSRVPDIYVLSLSTLLQPGLFGEDYDTVLRIPNYAYLAHAIVQASHGKLLGWDCKVLSYATRSSHAADAVLEANPFIKPDEFAWQREARAVFLPSDPIQEYLDIQSEEIASLVRLA
jgi:hypothetical protein